MGSALQGKVAIITGGARGMGRAIAKSFVEEGCAVGLLDIETGELAQVVKELQTSENSVLGQVADVRDYDQVKQAVDKLTTELGTPDILVNAAGLAAGGRVHEITEELWDLCFDVNVKGIFHLCKAVVPLMLTRESGQIINIASLSAWIRGAAGASCYGASKYAVRGFSRYLAVELRPNNIGVCCLSPGTTDSHFRGQPTGNPNWMQAEDVAQAALYIATRRKNVAVAELGFSMINEAW